MKQLLILGLAGGLAACAPGDDSTNDASPPATAPTVAANGTDYVATIRDMPEGQRRATFLRAIRDANQACQQVVDDRASDPVDGNAAWGVRCEDGRGWLISIAPDGNAKVTGPVARK
jgi:hypothetical protein